MTDGNEIIDKKREREGNRERIGKSSAKWEKMELEDKEVTRKMWGTIGEERRAR